MFDDINNRRLMEVYATFEALADQVNFTGLGVLVRALRQGTDNLLRLEGEGNTITLYEGLDKVAQLSLFLTEEGTLCLEAECQHGTLLFVALVANDEGRISLHLSSRNRDIDPREIPRFARIVHFLAAYKPLGDVAVTVNRPLMKAALGYAMGYIAAHGTPLLGSAYLPDMLNHLPWYG